MKSSITRLATASILLLVITTASSLAEAPVTVSPGSASGLALTDARCPAFSWGSVSGASSYELVVYRLGEEGEKAQPVLQETFAGSVSGWTPPADRCFERGGRYAWSVRALGNDTHREWSPASLFKVVSGPGNADFEEALAVVQRYLSLRGRAGEAVETAPEDETGEPTASREPAGDAPETLAVAATQLSVEGGVVATSFAGDGSALSGVIASDLDGVASVSEAELDFDPAIQTELDTHESTADAHGEHATLEESAEIDTDIATHAALPGVHHALPIGLPPTGTAGGDLTGTYPNPGVADGMARDSEVTSGIASHAGITDAHREHATLEESAEIDTDIATHGALPSVHHIQTVDTDTVLTEPQVEAFVTNGPLDGSNFTSVTAVAGDSATGFFLEGQIEEARIVDAITRDSELQESRCNDFDAQGATPPASFECPLTVFVTSSVTDGNLGGLAGGDAFCQSIAEGAGLVGTFKAWLSDNTDSPSTRFAHGNRPYELVDGTRVANDWTDLTDGTIQAEIDMTEAGGLLGGSLVFTGTQSDGTPVNTSWFHANCVEWTVAADPTFPKGGTVGRSDESDLDWTGDWSEIAFCDTELPLYCFQQQATASSGAASDLACTDCVSETELDFETATDAELTGHSGASDAHREHATLEESAEIDADIATHGALPNVHHTPPTGLPPSGAAGGDLTGTYPNPGVANEISRDSEVTAGIAGHAGITDVHREHATLEESAEIDADIATHGALPNVHHTLPLGLPPTGAAGGDLTGTYPNPGVADGIARDSEVTADIASHTSADDAHREHATLEESDEIDTDIAAQAALDAAAHVDVAGDTMVGTLNLPTNGLTVGTSQLVAANARVGIGTQTPGAKLEVVGDVKIVDGTQGDGKVLTSDGSGLASWQAASSGVPARAVMFFNLGSCPSGWTALTSAQGRYLVGLPASGTLAGATGTALSDGEDRPVGVHNHNASSSPPHNHGYTRPSGQIVAVDSYSGGSGYSVRTAAETTSYTSSYEPSITVFNTGTWGGTNAPYLQLLVCQKN